VDQSTGIAPFPVRDERGELLPDEVREFSARRVDEHEQLVGQIVEDVGPSHLHRLADDLLLVLVEGHEDAFLAVLEPPADELGCEGRLARAGPADHNGRAVLIHAAIQKRVEAVDPAPNLAHTISSGQGH